MSAVTPDTLLMGLMGLFALYVVNVFFPPELHMGSTFRTKRGNRLFPKTYKTLQNPTLTFVAFLFLDLRKQLLDLT